jgi:serine protease
MFHFIRCKSVAITKLAALALAAAAFPAAASASSTQAGLHVHPNAGLAQSSAGETNEGLANPGSSAEHEVPEASLVSADPSSPAPPAPGRHVEPVHPAPVLSPQATNAKGASVAEYWSSDYMLYRGGPVQTSPRLYISYWGDWSWTGDPYNLEDRLYKFTRGIGGSVWNESATQFAQGCTAGTYSCGSGAAFIKNLAGQYQSLAHDHSYLPQSPSESDVRAAAIRAAVYFREHDANALTQNTQIILALPQGHDPSWFPSTCAYHAVVSVYGQPISFTVLPYIPDAGHNCWNYSASGSVLDGYTIVESHEYSESETDPFLNAWNDSTGNKGESGDKCAGLGGFYVRSMTFSTGTFPVQSTWSNYDRYYHANGCAF